MPQQDWVRQSLEGRRAVIGEVLAALQVAVGEVYVMVGGVAVRDLEHARELGADGWAASARRVAAQLDALPDGIEGADVG